jgi:hypothetical protein
MVAVKGGAAAADQDPDDPQLKNKRERGRLDENQQDKPRPRDRKMDDADWWKRGATPAVLTRRARIAAHAGLVANTLFRESR